MTKKAIGVFSLLPLLLGGATGLVLAENTKGRWDLGGSLYYWSTTDDIRSNAAFVLFDQPGPDGIPNTGDETILFADPRPDDILSRETTLQEGPAFNFNAAYGITDLISIEFDASYYNADVVQLDTYVEQRQFVDFTRDGIWDANEIFTFTQSQPFSPGTVTQLPLSLSLVFRFRKDSPLNPYVGIGAGYVLVDTQVDSRLEEINATLATSEECAQAGLPPGCRISVVGTNNFFPLYQVCQGTACPPFEGFQLQVDDTFEWHAMAGAEYFVKGSKVSLVFDARYMVSDAGVSIKSPSYQAYDQLFFVYRSPSDTLPLCGDPALDTYVFPTGFNRTDSGLVGVCRAGGPLLPGQPEPRLQDSLLIQGGDISLTNFQFGVGVRFYF